VSCEGYAATGEYRNPRVPPRHSAATDGKPQCQTAAVQKGRRLLVHDPGRTRTGDLLLRRQSLYPPELRGRSLPNRHNLSGDETIFQSRAIYGGALLLRGLLRVRSFGDPSESVVAGEARRGYSIGVPLSSPQRTASRGNDVDGGFAEPFGPMHLMRGYGPDVGRRCLRGCREPQPCRTHRWAARW
jgi:hypothetical protein